MHTLLDSVPLTLKQATADPETGCYLPTPPLETPGHSWIWLGQFLGGSLLLSSGSWCTEIFVRALQEYVSPGLCKFWWFYGGANGDLLQQGLCHMQVCCTQNPCSRHNWPVPPQETLRHSSDSVSVGWAGILCPSHVWAAQANRCLVSALSQVSLVS